MIVEKAKLFEGFTIQKMNSSNLSQVAYRPEENLLRVSFKNGGVYQYKTVPEDVIQEWLNAESKGSFFYKNISKTYPYEKLTITDKLIKEGEDNVNN